MKTPIFKIIFFLFVFYSSPIIAQNYTTFTDGYMRYYIDIASTGEVSCCGPTSKDVSVKNPVIKDYVSYQGRYYKVTSIMSSAFGSCPYLTGDLVIPNTVNRISQYAFTDCSGFNGSLTLSKSLEYIGVSAFSGCKGFTGSLILPESLTTINDYAFQICRNFSGSLIIPNKVTVIRNNAFVGCENFTDLTLGENLQSLGAGSNQYIGNTFKDCSKLQWVKCLSKVPPTAYGSNFSDYTIPLYVPAESVSAYSLANDWKNFINILPIPVECESLTLNIENLELLVGRTSTLRATIKPANTTDKTVTWTSDKPEIATVDADGTVTAVSEGEAVITAKCGSVAAQCTVKVNPIIPVTGITITNPSLAINVGDTHKIDYTIQPANATEPVVIWTSSNQEIAAVSDDGVVIGIKAGKAVITAECQGQQATCMVTVSNVEARTLKIIPADVTIKMGQTTTLDVTITPDNTTDKTIVWSYAPEGIVSVENNVITTLKKGSTVLTATCGSASATCNVTVEAADVTSISITPASSQIWVGHSIQLSTIILPEVAADNSVVWSVDEESIANIDSETGLVRGISQGEVFVIATCGGKSAYAIVKVVPAGITVTPGNGTTEGDEDGSLADNTENGGSLQGNDLTLRVGQTAELVVKVNEELTVAPSFDWTLAEGGNAFVTLTVSDDTLTASFTGIAMGATTYSIYVEGQQDALVTGNILVLDKDGAGVDDITVDGGDTITVYNLQGIRLPITNRKELNSLPTGVYIVNSKKEMVK